MTREQLNALDAWCILRTAGPRTLKLADALTERGLEAWTPRAAVKRRLPRGRKGSVERVAPMLPTFVFARAAHLPILRMALARPANPHPAFSIFQHDGRTPLIGDRDLATLRGAEDRANRAVRKRERHVIPIGSEVRTTEAGFTGLPGIVIAGDGKFATVRFGLGFEVKIATFLLRTDRVQELEPA